MTDAPAAPQAVVSEAPAAARVIDSFASSLNAVELAPDFGADSADTAVNTYNDDGDAQVQVSAREPAPTTLPPDAPVAAAAAPTAPAVDFGQIMQQQQMWMAQQQQQYTQLVQTLPQLMAQSMQGVLPKPPPAPPVDPYAALDQNDPDYHFNRLGIQNKLLQDRLDAQEAKWAARDQEQAQQAQQAQQQAAASQGQAYVKSEVERTIWPLFKDVERTPAIDRLYQLACDQMANAWSATGYQTRGAAQGWRSAKSLVDEFLPAIRNKQAAVATQARGAGPAPLGGNRAATQAAATAATSHTDFWANLEKKNAGDAGELKSILNGWNN